SASPHAVAVVRRRQEATAGRMAIDAQAGLEHRLLEEAPLPQGRQGLASGGGRLAEGGGDALEQVVTQVVLGFFGSPGPGGECGVGHGWHPGDSFLVPAACNAARRFENPDLQPPAFGYAERLFQVTVPTAGVWSNHAFRSGRPAPV